MCFTSEGLYVVQWKRTKYVYCIVIAPYHPISVGDITKKKINLSIFEPFGEIQNAHYRSKVWVGKLFLMVFKSLMLIQ